MAVNTVATPFGKTQINAAIAACNSEAAASGESAAADTVLRFPSRTYPITGPLTPARGNYSIIMDPGAYFIYTPTDTTPVTGTINQKMWTIGDINVNGARTWDLQGVIQFDLAAEQDGAGLTPFSSAYPNNIAFEFINMSHYWLTIRRASGFHTGLSMRAHGAAGAEYRYMYDVTVNLGYLHSCYRTIVQVTANEGWQNNIRYYNGNFAPPVSGTRYMSMIAETGGGENKASMTNPLFDGLDFTALYAQGGSCYINAQHMENPTNNGAFSAGGIIEHPAGSVAANPSYVFMGGLESKILEIKDLVDHGSFGHDPFFGMSYAPRPRLITGNHTITLGNIRRQDKIQTAVGDAATRTVTMPAFGGDAPPITSTVYFKRRGPGSFLIDHDANVTFIVPGGKANNPVVLRAQNSEAVAYLEDDGSPRIWSINGDLADA